MAVLTPGSMKNKISFYRESLTVGSSGEKVKTLSLIKRDVGAEFKYIGTPSAGASEEQIQEQRTGKIKAEIRCRYFPGVKFEDVIYFEGGKFRIYSIQYEGRHEVLKIRAELRDDDTYFGMPDDYQLLPSSHQYHVRTSADFKVVENTPFPKETGNSRLFELPVGGLEIQVGDGIDLGTYPEGNVSLSIVSDRDQFPYKIDSGSDPEPQLIDGKVYGYTVPWYDMYPDNSNPYARIEVDGVIIAEKNDTNQILIGAETELDPIWKTAEEEKKYLVTTKDFEGVSDPFYNLKYGDNPGFLYYRMTPVDSNSSYLSTINAKDAENSPIKVTGGSLFVEYSLPINLHNLSIDFPSVSSRVFRQDGMISGLMSIDTQDPLTTINATELPKNGNVRVLDVQDNYTLSVQTINSVTIVVDGVEIVTGPTAEYPLNTEYALIDRFEPIPIDGVSPAGIRFKEQQLLEYTPLYVPAVDENGDPILDENGEPTYTDEFSYDEFGVQEFDVEPQYLPIQAVDENGDPIFDPDTGWPVLVPDMRLQSLNEEWRGGEITFNVDLGPVVDETIVHYKDEYQTQGINLTYKLV